MAASSTNERFWLLTSTTGSSGPLSSKVVWASLCWSRGLMSWDFANGVPDLTDDALVEGGERVADNGL